MGKPGTKEVTVRLPVALHAEVAAAAEERDVSVNWLLNRAVVEFMARLLPLAEFTLTRPPEPASPKRWPEAQVPPDGYVPSPAGWVPGPLPSGWEPSTPLPPVHDKIEPQIPGRTADNGMGDWYG